MFRFFSPTFSSFTFPLPYLPLVVPSTIVLTSSHSFFDPTPPPPQKTPFHLDSLGYGNSTFSLTSYALWRSFFFLFLKKPKGSRVSRGGRVDLYSLCSLSPFFLFPAHYMLTNPHRHASQYTLFLFRNRGYTCASFFEASKGVDVCATVSLHLFLVSFSLPHSPSPSNFPIPASYCA